VSVLSYKLICHAKSYNHCTKIFNSVATFSVFLKEKKKGKRKKRNEGRKKENKKEHNKQLEYSVVF
jgi:hypothetical protein